jgi:hypothetical protein
MYRPLRAAAAFFLLSFLFPRRSAVPSSKSCLFFFGVIAQQLFHALCAPVFCGVVQWRPRMHAFCVFFAPTRSRSFMHFLRLFLAAQCSGDLECISYSFFRGYCLAAAFCSHFACF